MKKAQWETMIDFQSADFNQGSSGVQGLALLLYSKKGVGWRPRPVGSPFVCTGFSQVLWLLVTVQQLAWDANWELWTGLRCECECECKWLFVFHVAKRWRPWVNSVHRLQRLTFFWAIWCLNIALVSYKGHRAITFSCNWRCCRLRF